MIQLPGRFDDIRPYYDSEIPAAMERIASDYSLDRILRFLGWESESEGVRKLLRSISTIDELQGKVMQPALEEIVRRSVSELTCEGIENVDRENGVLYVSNHRDITMDALLQQNYLYRNSVPTSHITFGSNLMNPQFVSDIGLSNKMFKTVRKSRDYQEFMDSSIHLSDYIRYVVTHGESVWIAQRNGRTKDGTDRTEPGLMRMLMLGRRNRSDLEALNITPVSVSYQWEPCDILKAVELYRSRDGKPYVKAPGEDMNSIITGITSFKGKVSIAICRKLDLSSMGEKVGRSEIIGTATLVDREIYSAYRLWDTNYAAYDILEGCGKFAGLYTPELKEEFLDRMERQIESYGNLDRNLLREIYLKIYAGPVYTSRRNGNPLPND